jgi:hypothetical protein
MRGVPKFPYFRDKNYLRYVASYPCFGCGIEGYSQAAHSNQSKWGHGRSVKATDTATFPLCCQRPGHQGCHMMHDLRLDGLSKEKRNQQEDEWIERMHQYAKRDGWNL